MKFWTWPYFFLMYFQKYMRKKYISKIHAVIRNGLRRNFKICDAKATIKVELLFPFLDSIEINELSKVR